MRVLAINNYSLDRSLEDSKSGVSPKHHCWGIDYMMDMGHKVDTMLFKPPQNSGLFRKCLYAIAFNLRLLRKVNEYDVVIAFANPIIALLAVLKKIGCLGKHVKLYTMVHHYERLTLINGGYEKIFFLSKDIMTYAMRAYPTLKNKFEYLIWGGDIPFYAPFLSNIEQNILKPDLLIMNGKTARDVPMFVSACEDMSIPYIVITDKVDVSFSQGYVYGSGKSGKNALSYQEMLSLMKKATISVVPIVADRSSSSLTGLTSFLDAAILGTPIIMSDNTNISVDIERLEMGYFYHAGDKADFERKVRLLLSDKARYIRMSKKCSDWAKKNDYQSYSKHLYACVFSS